jgi:hypothetical protein
MSFADVYTDAFVRRSHELLVMGHARLAATELATLDEPEITGKLSEAMEATLDADDRPEWATHLTVVDEEPENVDGKIGARRPRADVCVRCINPRPARRFRFEAKRLNGSGAMRAYLGEDGMLALLRGYYGELPYSGMIGYVQTGACAVWREEIKSAIRTAPARFEAVVPVEFPELPIKAPEPVFYSQHQQSPAGSRKHITHALLPCA